MRLFDSHDVNEVLVNRLLGQRRHRLRSAAALSELTVLLQIASFLFLLLNLANQFGYLLRLGPTLRLVLAEDQYVFVANFKRAKFGKEYALLRGRVVILVVGVVLSQGSQVWRNLIEDHLEGGVAEGDGAPN